MHCQIVWITHWVAALFPWWVKSSTYKHKHPALNHDRTDQFPSLFRMNPTSALRFIGSCLNIPQLWQVRDTKSTQGIETSFYAQNRGDVLNVLSEQLKLRLYIYYWWRMKKRHLKNIMVIICLHLIFLMSQTLVNISY